MAAGKIGALVQDSLSAMGDPNAAEVARSAKKIYDKRSTLVHQGTLPAGELSEALNGAKVIVEAVLRAKFLLAMKSSPV